MKNLLQSAIASLSCVISVSSFCQAIVPFDACDSTFFYSKAGPKVVQTKLVGASMVNLFEVPLLRVGNTGEINGLAGNYNDGFIYYQNKSGGIGYLIRMDANGDTTVVTNFGAFGYTANGGFDACNRYLRFKNNIGILRYDLITGIEDTILVPGLSTSPDIMYNPYNGLYYHYTNADGKVHVVDSTGDVLTAFSSGMLSAGSVSLTQDGKYFVIQNDLTIKWFHINSGLPFMTKTLPTMAANAPIADNGTFVCDDVQADITGGTDTMEIHTCQDSATVNFSNFSSGTMNKFWWNFGDGNIDTMNMTPTHTFASNNTYTVTFTATKFTYGTCHIDDPNIDSLIVKIVPDTVQITLAGSDPVCNDGTDGTAEVVSVTGGTAPYAYDWTPSGASSALVSGLSWGMHYVTVTDFNNCSTSDSVFLNNPSAIDASLVTTNNSCNASDDATATVTPGPLAVGPYTYLYSTGATTPAVSGLSAGAYSVTVYDINLCELNFPFVITEPTPVVVDAGNDTLICINGTAGLNPSASGGNGGPYSYTWAGLPSGTTSVSPAVNTCYTVTAYDISGCASLSDDVCVDLRDPINVSLTGDDVCPGQWTELDATITGGDGDYSYNWTADGIPASTASGFIPTPPATTNYCLTVSDGCETADVTACITITVFDIPSVTLNPAFGCEGLSVNFPPVPGGGSDFFWSFGDGASSTGAGPSHEYGSDGVYTVTIDYTSVDGCSVSTVFENLVTILESPRAHFSYSPNGMITVENTEVEFTNTSVGATHYLWDFGDGYPVTTEEDPTHTFPDAPNQMYPVTLWAINEMCKDSITILIEVKDIIILYVPNAFTPDGGGMNDEFKPVVTAGVDIYDYHFTVFNRWGERVFESYNPAAGWNGTYSDEGIASEDTYVWQIIFKETMSDKMHEERGHVTLLR